MLAVTSAPAPEEQGAIVFDGDSKAQHGMRMVNGNGAAESMDLVAYLCDLDCGMQCLLDKVKQDMQAVKDATMFLKKRATIEEEYGKVLIKSSQTMSEQFDRTNPKSGTFGDVYMSMLKIHEHIGEQRIDFSKELLEIADDLNLLYKDTEKSRKAVKEAGVKQDKHLLEVEAQLEKAKQRYEAASEDWERSILQKTGDPLQNSKKGLFKQSKTMAQLGRVEKEARLKASQSNQSYKNQLVITNAARREYYQSHLPKMLQSLKDIDDECQAALRYQLARYAYAFEQAMLKDGMVLDNDDGTGIRSILEKIDREVDIQDYVKSYGGRSGKRNKSEIPYKEYNMSSTARSVLGHASKPIFGVDLATQMERDGEEVPLILVKCAQAVETHGLQTQGIYRSSGTHTIIQKLRAALDRNVDEVDLNADEYISDINNIASVVKLWFRELPDPLFPRDAYAGFIQAAQIRDEKRRIIEIHSRVNDLPDPNYATLKYLMCHLDKVQANQIYNKMGAANLSILFAPTLMGGDYSTVGNGSAQPGGMSPNALLPLSPLASHAFSEDVAKMADMGIQAKVIETILENYRVIFEPDDE